MWLIIQWLPGAFMFFIINLISPELVYLAGSDMGKTELRDCVII